MYDLLIVILLGTIAGSITGIIPGLHVNTISSFIIALNLDNPLFAFFIISMGITHTFVDAIPTVLLGAPDESIVMGVFPAHKLLIKGAGYEAIKLTVVGSFFGLITTVALIPAIFQILKLIKQLNKSIIVYLLILAIILLVIKEKKFKRIIFASAAIFFSSTVGFLSLDSFNQPLFHMLTGFYGISGLILSLKQNNISKQFRTDIIRPKFLNTILISFKGFLCSLLIISLPGLGPSQSASLGRTLFSKFKISTALIFTGSLNTIDYVLSLTTLYTINRARNGSIEAINQIINVNSSFYALLIAIFISGSLAVVLTLLISRIAIKLINKINYFVINIIVIIFLLCLSFYFDSFNGILLLVTCSFVGLIAPLTKISRSHYMSCLIVPLIFNMSF